MAFTLIEEVNVTLTVRLLKVQITDGDPGYLTSIANIAAGSGDTPEKAYEGLAICLAVGDIDVPNEDRIESWKRIIQQAVEQAHKPSSP